MFSFYKAGKVAVSATVGCMAAYMFIKQTMIAPEFLAYCLVKPVEKPLLDAGCVLFSLIEGLILSTGTIAGGLLGAYERTPEEHVDPTSFGFTS